MADEIPTRMIHIQRLTSLAIGTLTCGELVATKIYRIDPHCRKSYPHYQIHALPAAGPFLVRMVGTSR
jgi:hypothetical protein